MQRRWEIVRVSTRDFLQLRLKAGELIGQHGLKQRDLTREMGVERFLADRQLLRQVVHGYVPEAVAEEVCPRRLHDSLRISVSS